MAFWNDRAQVDLDSGVNAARKKLLESLYEGENATEMVSDVNETEAAAQSRALRTGAPAPRQVRREDDEQQRLPEGEQQGAFGPTMFSAFSAGGSAPAPQVNSPRSTPNESRPQGSLPPTGGNLANRQNEINRLLSIPVNAAMKFMQVAVPGARGGPSMPHQGSAWKTYQDTSANPPAQRDTGYLNPPTPGGGAGGGFSGGGGFPSNLPDPFGASYRPLSPGGNNTPISGHVTGDGYVKFQRTQAANGSDRITRADINGVPIYKFTVKPGDRASNGNRAEIVGTDQYSAGQTVTFNWSTMLPSDFVGPKWGTFLQFHSPSPVPVDGGVGNWGVHLHGTTLGVYTNDGTFHPIGAAPIGKWANYEMTVKFGRGNSGHVQLKIDGNTVFNQAANTFDNQGTWHVKQGYYRADTGTTGVVYSTPLRYGPAQQQSLPQPGQQPAPQQGGARPPSGNKPPPEVVLQTLSPYMSNRMGAVTPNLFQSSLPSQEAWPLFSKMGFDVVVTARHVQNSTPIPGVENYFFEMQDAKPTAVEWQRAQQAADLVYQSMQAGKRVLVHDTGGNNRAGLIPALVLIKMGYSPQAAIDQVQKSKPGSLNNEYFVRGILTGSPF